MEQWMNTPKIKSYILSGIDGWRGVTFCRAVFYTQHVSIYQNQINFKGNVCTRYYYTNAVCGISMLSGRNNMSKIKGLAQVPASIADDLPQHALASWDTK